MKRNQILLSLILAGLASSASATFCDMGTVHAGQPEPFYPDRCNDPLVQPPVTQPVTSSLPTTPLQSQTQTGTQTQTGSLSGTVNGTQGQQQGINLGSGSVSLTGGGAGGAVNVQPGGIQGGSGGAGGQGGTGGTAASGTSQSNSQSRSQSRSVANAQANGTQEVTVNNGPGTNGGTAAGAIGAGATVGNRSDYRVIVHPSMIPPSHVAMNPAGSMLGINTSCGPLMLAETHQVTATSTGFWGNVEKTENGFYTVPVLARYDNGQPVGYQQVDMNGTTMFMGSQVVGAYAVLNQSIAVNGAVGLIRASGSGGQVGGGASSALQQLNKDVMIIPCFIPATATKVVTEVVPFEVPAESLPLLHKSPGE